MRLLLIASGITFIAIMVARASRINGGVVPDTPLILPDSGANEPPVESAPRQKDVVMDIRTWITSLEGRVLRAYRDTAGRLTIGVGHLIKAGEHLSVITSAQADELLDADLRDAVSAVDNRVRVALTENQRTALISFVFNVGVNNFATSKLLTLVNTGDFKAAANEFGRWNKTRVNGILIVDNGLTARRAKERDLFERG